MLSSNVSFNSNFHELRVVPVQIIPPHLCLEEKPSPSPKAFKALLDLASISLSALTLNIGIQYVLAVPPNMAFIFLSLKEPALV